jgi:hypothetical protein
VIGRFQKRKYFIMRKQKVLTLNDLSLIKIRVFDVINDDGFVKENWHGIKRIELKPIELPNAQIGIALLRDGERLGMWRVYEQQISQLPPLLNEDDGTVAANRSPSSIYYVYGLDNKRYRWLYYRPFPNGQFQIGTRKDIGARWASRCMSKRERKENEDLKILRLIRRKKWLRAERKIQEKLRGVAQQRRANEEAAIKKRNRKAAIEWENSRFISRYWKR